MTSHWTSVVLPVAGEDDAEASARAVGEHLPADATVHVVHVVEKAGGAPDKASVEQRKEVGEAAFERVRSILGEDRVRTHIRYGTDVAETVFDAAAEVDADVIAFTPRGGSRWIRLLTGDVALDLITRSERPVVVLPDVEEA